MMPTKHFAAFVPIVLVATFLLGSCTKRDSCGYMLGLYRSDNPAVFATTLSGFQAWLTARGLQPVPSPGGPAEWSGMHTEGDENAWYALAVGGQQVFLRVTVTARGTQINASTSYDGAFTTKESADMRRQNHQLWLEIIAWFEAHAPENVVAEHPKEWFSDAQHNIDRTYTEDGM